MHLTRDSIRLFSIGIGFLFTNNVHRNLFLAKKGGVVSSKENATEGVNNHSVLFIYLFIYFVLQHFHPIGLDYGRLGQLLKI